MQPGREVRRETVITGSLHTQDEMRRQKAVPAKRVPVGREGLKERSFRSHQQAEIKGKEKQRDR